MLSPVLPELLRTYYKTEKQKPKVWLFEGQYGGQYSVRTVQEVLQHTKQKAGIKKKAGIHPVGLYFGNSLSFYKE